MGVVTSSWAGSERPGSGHKPPAEQSHLQMCLTLDRSQWGLGSFLSLGGPEVGSPRLLGAASGGLQAGIWSQEEATGLPCVL
jgi:hypothetical protein